MRLRTFLALSPVLLTAVLVSFFMIRWINGPEFDIVIKNGIVVDGLGNPPIRADVGISGDKITKVGKISKKKAKRVVDAAGLTVCPGFIDIHTHTDSSILKHPDAHNYIRQGVTTVLAGNCGSSPYPIGDFLEKLLERKIALNFGILVGHNTIRRRVMGNVDSPPDEAELREMKEMVEDAMLDGALGLSTGLKYTPGIFADTREIIELAGVAARYDGIYATHLREEGMGILESIKEAISVGSATGIAVQISHHKITSLDMWGSSEKTLATIDEARQKGVTVGLDQYPYPATSTDLTILFPSWALQGNPEDWPATWKDKKIEKRLIKEIEYNIRHDRGANDLSRIMLARCTLEPELEGMTVKQILEKRQIAPTMEAGARLIVELLSRQIEEKATVDAIYFCLNDDDVERIVKYPHTVHASDGSIRVFGQGKPHPRNYGTFPRVLKTYVKEKKLLTVQEAVRKMTALPAARLGLADRGLIKEGYRADIVVVDLEQVCDTATWEHPHQYPQGIPYVLVNGKPVVDRYHITGLLPGKVLFGKGKNQSPLIEID